MGTTAELRTVTVSTLGIETTDGRNWALCVGKKPAWRGLVEVPDGKTVGVGQLIMIRHNGNRWVML